MKYLVQTKWNAVFVVRFNLRNFSFDPDGAELAFGRAGESPFLSKVWVKVFNWGLCRIQSNFCMPEG